MLTFQKAKEIAEDSLKKATIDSGIKFSIIDNDTIEKPYAWIFFYHNTQPIGKAKATDALAGNSPFFISKIDGHLSVFPSGLNIDEMIDEFEENNKIWELVLTDNATFDTKEFLNIKQILRWTNETLAGFKHSKSKILDAGAKTRLIDIQVALKDRKIKTELNQKNCRTNSCKLYNLNNLNST